MNGQRTVEKLTDCSLADIIHIQPDNQGILLPAARVSAEGCFKIFTTIECPIVLPHRRMYLQCEVNGTNCLAKPGRGFFTPEELSH